MIIVVPFSIDEPTKASWYISVTADVNGICTVTAICSPFATTDLPWDTWRRGEQQGVIQDKWPHIPARNMLDLRPNVGDPSSRFRKRVGRYSTGGARSTVGLMSRIARLKTLCVKGGTHPQILCHAHRQHPAVEGQRAFSLGERPEDGYAQGLRQHGAHDWLASAVRPQGG